MVGTFKANNPFNPFILFVYGFLLKLGWFLHPQVAAAQKTDGFLYVRLINLLSSVLQNVHFFYPLITYLLLFSQALWFNKIVSDQKLMLRSNYLPAMCYLLITSLFAEWNILSAPLIINTLLIWVWARINSLYNTNNPKSTLYNIGIATGLATFFYFPSLAFVLLIIFAITATRTFKLSEWIVAILGIITPYYFLLAYLFLSDKFKGYTIPKIGISYPVFQHNFLEIVAIGVIALLFLIGCYFVYANVRKQLMQVRKSWNLVLCYLLVALFLPFINSTKTFEYWIMSVLPLSAYLGAAFFYPVKRWMPVTLHWLIVFLVIAISYKLY